MLSDLVRERIQAIGETLLGSALLTLPFWSNVFDRVIYGAHAIAALCGMALGIHGVWRMIRKRGRRREDREQPSDGAFERPSTRG